MYKSADEKITLLQALLIYIVAIFPASLRYINANAAQGAQQASWLVIICSMIVFIPLLYMLYRVMRKFEGRSLHEILGKVFGRVVGYAISLMFLFWLFLLLCMYEQFMVGTLAATVFVGTDTNLLLFVLVVIVGVMLRWGIGVIARMNKLVFVLIIITLAITLFFLFLHFRLDFVTPISTLDIVPVLQTIIYPLTLFLYVTPIFVFNDKITYDQKNFGKLAFAVGYLTIKNTVMILAIVGMLGHHVVSKLVFPYFTAVQNISIFDSSAGFDSLFMSIRSLAEFVTVMFFAYCLIRIVKNVLNLKGETPLLTPVLGLSFFFSIYFNNSAFEIILFSKRIVPYLNLAFGLAIPILLFFTAKIRKLI